MTGIFDLSDFSVLGSWASLAGLLLTFITFTLLLGVKKRFLFRSSIDDHLEKVANLSKEISPLLQSFSKNQKDIEERFALADVELRAMQRGASGDLLNDIKKSRSMIRKYTLRIYFWVEKNETSARDIKTSLSVVSAELYHHRKSLITGN